MRDLPALQHEFKHPTWAVAFTGIVVKSSSLPKDSTVCLAATIVLSPVADSLTAPTECLDLASASCNFPRTFRNVFASNELLAVRSHTSRT